MLILVLWHFFFISFYFDNYMAALGTYRFQPCSLQRNVCSLTDLVLPRVYNMIYNVTGEPCKQ